MRIDWILVAQGADRALYELRKDAANYYVEA